MSDNETKTRRWFEEVWNQRRAETIDELLSPDCLGHGLGPEDGPMVGPEGFKQFYAQFTGAFPDIVLCVEDVIASGDMTAIRLTASATHVGDHLGVPATNRPVTFSAMVFARWHNGKMVEAWNSVDMLGLYKQVGMV